ncbi:MAG TPA: hypothetical protein VD763_05830, partial [Candidatus Saccharimonadales bacterium]|nr:hypothetical protein [Candidatus Saccharimonadales bacterium]
RAEADRALTDLDAAESAASALAADLSARATAERERREAHEAARATLTDLQLRDGRVTSDLDALARDRHRLAEERAAAEAAATAARRSMAAPVPGRDPDLEAAVTEAERELADALAELGTLRTASQARGEELAALRRAEAARQAETETARRRLAEAQRRLEEERAAAATAEIRRTEVAGRHEAAFAALTDAQATETASAAAREAARDAAEAAEAQRGAATERAATASAALAALRGRLDALTERLDEDERRPIARAARKAGGRRVDDDLVVEPSLRAAVEAALADRARAYLVPGSSIGGLAAERGRLVVEERAAGDVDVRDAASRRCLDAVAAVGGGRLADAIERDSTGGARRLLARAVWVPDLAAALTVQAVLPAGWLVVPRDGAAVIDETTVTLGPPEGTLERRAEQGRLSAELERATAEAEAQRAAATAATATAAQARDALDSARAAEARGTGDRRRAEEAERVAARETEAIAREVAWHAAQLERLAADAERARTAIPAEAASGAGVEGTSTPGADPDRSALATWEARAAELRDRRDRLAARLAAHDTARQAAEQARTRADAGASSAEERVARADRESAALAGREAELQADRDGLRTEVATATAAEAAARQALAALHAADATDRSRLSDAERAASGARERLRGADERLRAADHAELEARLGLEGLREGVLVELAGLGELGLAALGVASNARSAEEPTADEPRDEERGVAQAGRVDAAFEDDDDVAADTAALESALSTVADRWVAEPPSGPVPPPGRLAQLRRRYHELGAANPFAVEEYAELKTRLETLETQAADLRSAIAKTRELIEELDTLIAEQFRTTFQALETAFERRFEQLFGGGYARLSLTDPSDLGSTGVEIVARPPGKKPQALAMLSGGERALTAVALLFAMLEVRPVPFCVLDEVDAALDEANIGRFAAALRSLAHQTQFIVITHNRGTIEAADALYGVTVGDDSVSRVISLRLDEAQALASDRRRELAPVD